MCFQHIIVVQEASLQSICQKRSFCTFRIKDFLGEKKTLTCQLPNPHARHSFSAHNSSKLPLALTSLPLTPFFICTSSPLLHPRAWSPSSHSVKASQYQIFTSFSLKSSSPSYLSFPRSHAQTDACSHLGSRLSTSFPGSLYSTPFSQNTNPLISLYKTIQGLTHTSATTFAHPRV